MYEACSFTLTASDTPLPLFSPPAFLSLNCLLDTCMGEILNYPYLAKGLIVLFKAVQFKVMLEE